MTQETVISSRETWNTTIIRLMKAERSRLGLLQKIRRLTTENRKLQTQIEERNETLGNEIWVLRSMLTLEKNESDTLRKALDLQTARLQTSEESRVPAQMAGRQQVLGLLRGKGFLPVFLLTGRAIARWLESQFEK